MSNSFGEGYATRSDEEGFGGIYSDTQQLNKDRKEINENSPGKQISHRNFKQIWYCNASLETFDKF